MQDFGKWLLGWIATSGFAGLSAVIAATIAFLASWRGRVADRLRFERSHWWQLAKWATDNLASDNKRRVDVGFLALNYLAQDPPGQQEEDYVYQLFEDFAGDFVIESEADEGDQDQSPHNDTYGGDLDTGLGAMSESMLLGERPGLDGDVSNDAGYVPRPREAPRAPRPSADGVGAAGSQSAHPSDDTERADLTVDVTDRVVRTDVVAVDTSHQDPDNEGNTPTNEVEDGRPKQRGWRGRG